MSTRSPAVTPATGSRQVGYYVHHVGAGHRLRAVALAERLRSRHGVGLTGLGSMSRPRGWVGGWIELPRDDDGTDPIDVTARGRLHWAPRHDRGLADRQAAIAAWVHRARPALVVVDVSVEVTVLVRLLGVPVVSVVLPGTRDDPAHRLGFDLADELVGFWPADVTGRVLTVPDAVRSRVHAVGALSRFEVGTVTPGAPGRRVLALSGAGGAAWSQDELDRVRRSSPGWSWTVLGEGTWTEDPATDICAADVVVTHAGQNALADVAALRRPAVVVPAPRPHSEQQASARALADAAWPAVVLGRLGSGSWPAVLEHARTLDADGWSRWCDGGAAGRACDVVVGVLERELR